MSDFLSSGMPNALLGRPDRGMNFAPGQMPTMPVIDPAQMAAQYRMGGHSGQGDPGDYGGHMHSHFQPMGSDNFQYPGMGRRHGLFGNGGPPMQGAPIPGQVNPLMPVNLPQTNPGMQGPPVSQVGTSYDSGNPFAPRSY